MNFNLNEKVIEIDESLPYAEFFLDAGKPEFNQLNLIQLLKDLESGDVKFELAKKELKLLSRWVTEAPRKRMYRDIRLGGITVASSEYFFDKEENGAEMIDMLENSGHLAVKVLAAYDEKPIGEITNEGPDPVSGKELEELLE